MPAPTTIDGGLEFQTKLSSSKLKPKKQPQQQLTKRLVAYYGRLTGLESSLRCLINSFDRRDLEDGLTLGLDYLRTSMNLDRSTTMRPRNWDF